MHQLPKRYKSIKKRSKRTILSISAFEVNIDVDPSNCEHNITGKIVINMTDSLKLTFYMVIMGYFDIMSQRDME